MHAYRESERRGEREGTHKGRENVERNRVKEKDHKMSRLYREESLGKEKHRSSAEKFRVEAGYASLTL